jgi:O-methyltransferase
MSDVCTYSSTYSDLERANAIYGEAFRKAFEYIYGCRMPGAVVEFGTYMGFTARILASLIREFGDDQECYPGHPRQNFYLYDSFAGFPDSTDPIDVESYELKVSGQWLGGSESVPPGTELRILDHLSTILPRERINLVKGFFADTIARTPLPEKVALLHLDCDLYVSSRTVLESLLAGGNLQDGCVICCDDYNCNRASPQQGQRRALRDVLGHRGSPFQLGDFFSYGWHGRAFFLHEE